LLFIGSGVCALILRFSGEGAGVAGLFSSEVGVLVFVGSGEGDLGLTGSGVGVLPMKKMFMRM